MLWIAPEHSLAQWHALIDFWATKQAGISSVDSSREGICSVETVGTQSIF
jgi:hypothetical protein